MKKLFIIFLIISSLLMVGCKKNIKHAVLPENFRVITKKNIDDYTDFFEPSYLNDIKIRDSYIFREFDELSVFFDDNELIFNDESLELKYCKDYFENNVLIIYLDIIQYYEKIDFKLFIKKNVLFLQVNRIYNEDLYYMDNSFSYELFFIEVKKNDIKNFDGFEIIQKRNGE